MTIVVGVDGSESSLDAVRLATMEASWRDCPLRIVHAFVWPLMHVPLGPSEAGPPDGGLQHEAERLLAQAVAIAQGMAASVKVSSELVTGAPTPVLLAAAQDADLVALGDRGLGGFTGLLVGSVAVQLAAHSPTPVLVVKRHSASGGSVVVGVDGSPESDAAVALAFQEADLRRCPLVAAHTWSGPAVQRGEEVVLAEAIAGQREQHPDVDVLEQVVHGSAARTLVELSKQAQLVVVGSRGRGGFAGLLLGSVSQQVLHHAVCPVLIVPRKG